MTRRDEEGVTAVVAWFLIGLLYVWVVSAFAMWDGGDRGARSSGNTGAVAATTQRVIAQAAIAECGWLLPDCHAAVWHVLRRRADRRGRTLAQTTRAYCALWSPRGGRTSRAQWVRSLHAPVAAASPRPHGWPGNASWPRHAPMWRAVYHRAGDMLRGGVGDPCGSTAWHFGGAMDEARAKRAGWVRVQCGDTGGQRFWGRR